MAEPGAGTLGADLQVLVEAWTGVAVDLYRRLVAPGEGLDQRNLVVSPSSVATVLAMILPGARGGTADEIATALHSRLDPQRLASAAGALGRALLEQARADELDLRISNAVWTQEGLALRQEFERALVEAFQAGLHRVDFRRDPDGARRAINLQARWLQAFDPDETRPEPFNLLNHGTTEAVMLHRQGRLGYARGDGWRAVELPYNGGRLVMDVILPDEGRFDRFRSGLEVERLRELLSALASREVRLALPKFTFDSDLDLRGPLQALGMRTAFTGFADFSGITEQASLRVDRFVQRAHIEVDERGTHAAAATRRNPRLTRPAPARPGPSRGFGVPAPALWSPRRPAPQLRRFSKMPAAPMPPPTHM